MNISKYVLFLFLTSSISLVSAISALEKIYEISYLPARKGFLARFTNESRIECTSDSLPPIHRPTCTYFDSQRKFERKEINWKNWFILRELFNYREKKAKNEIKAFEEEFQKMKEKAKSEADFIDQITNELNANLAS